MNRKVFQLADLRHFLMLLAVFAVLGLRGENTTMAQDAPSSLDESLESMGSLPWYDADQRSVEPVKVKPRMDDSINRDSRWVPKPKKAKKATPANAGTTGNNAPVSGFSALRDFLGSFSNILPWLVFGLVAIAIVTSVVIVFNKMQDISGDQAVTRARIDSGELDETDQVRLENLPIDVKRPVGDLLSESERLLAAGRIGDAIIYLFGHRLLQLDRAHLIRLSRGKTNRQYLGEMRSRSSVRAIMSETVELFEQSYFGGYKITTTQFEAVRSKQAELDMLLASIKEAA